MRRISRKRSAEVAAARQARQEYARETPYCDVPWCCELGTDTHEIARGPARRQAYQERCAWLRLCRLHHDQMGSMSVWPIERQLALKVLSDLPYYDRRRVNELRGRDAEAITEVEVLRYVLEFFRHGKP